MSKRRSDLAENFSSTSPSVDRDCLGFDDPVPAGACSSFFGCDSDDAHQLEAEVQRVLMGLPVEFSSLEVHRVPHGVCLSGTIHTSQIEDILLVEEAAKVEGVDRVINRLVVQAASVLDLLDEFDGIDR